MQYGERDQTLLIVQAPDKIDQFGSHLLIYVSCTIDDAYISPKISPKDVIFVA